MVDPHTLDAQHNAVKHIVERNRARQRLVPALEEAERTLYRLRSLSLRMQNENADDPDVGEELANELIAILRLPVRS